MPSPHEDNRDPSPSISMTAMPVRDVVTNALPLEDRIARPRQVVAVARRRCSFHSKLKDSLVASWLVRVI